MDLSQTIEAKSDQQNYDDYLAGPKVVTISEVKKGNKEQPVEVHLVEFPGKPFKPSKTMRRLMVSAWGPDSRAYAGRSLRLYGEPTVMFGGKQVGGIRISHMSHLAGVHSADLTVSRGTRAQFVVQPLATEADAAAWLQAASTMEELVNAWTLVQRWGVQAGDELVALKDARKEQLSEAGAE